MPTPAGLCDSGLVVGPLRPPFSQTVVVLVQHCVFLNAGYPDSTGTHAARERSSCNSHQAPVVLLRSLPFSSLCDRKSFLAWFHPPLSLGLIHSRCLGKTVQSIFQLGLQIPPGVSGIPVIAASKQRYACALAHMRERRGKERKGEARRGKEGWESASV